MNNSNDSFEKSNGSSNNSMNSNDISQMDFRKQNGNRDLMNTSNSVTIGSSLDPSQLQMLNRDSNKINKI